MDQRELMTILGIALWVIGAMLLVGAAFSKNKKALLVMIVATTVMLVGLSVLDYVGAIQ